MRYEAPAKINLNLLLSAPDASGMHPLHSVVQSIEWVDLLEVEVGDDDRLEFGDADLPEGGDNLVIRALQALRERTEIPPLDVNLSKSIPIGAGLGGGSSDAAATLVAACEAAEKPVSLARRVAPHVGADVTFPLTGGTAAMTGYGEQIEALAALTGFAIAVVVPEFPLSTQEVYETWDRLGGPEGFPVPDRLLPPRLRNQFPVRNDLYRAAVDVAPELGDFVADVGRIWDGAVMLTGSGSACFGFFSTPEEAEGAATAVPKTRAARGVALRPHGVARIE
jgi:4-diphosphocytidyl-2-C-methyl-D-erythritol kinase